MKSGIIRKIDDLGRVSIPREIRTRLKIQENDPIEIYTEGSTICLEKYIPSHYYLSSLERLIKLIEGDTLCWREEDKERVLRHARKLHNEMSAAYSVLNKEEGDNL